MKNDIVIIGAGPAGLSFAREMAETGLRITLIEREKLSVLEKPPYDGREIALTHLSRKILQNMSAWDLIPDEAVSLVRKAKVLNGASPYALSFDYRETDEDTLGFMVSNNQIRKAIFGSLRKFENVQILDEKSVASLGSDTETGWLTLESGERLEAPLIIAADSRFSSTRTMMGISTAMHDFGRTCVVGKMHTEYHHGDTAYECFQYDRTLAVLPLSNNEISIVITLGSEENARLLAMDAAALEVDIEKRLNKKFGKMNMVSKLFTYPLVSTFADRFYATRFALIGDAAVGMHPVTAHGFNLGLRGAHTLAGELTKANWRDDYTMLQDALGRYSRAHHNVAAPLYHGTNALVKLYTNDSLPAKMVRAALLRLGNHIAPAKRLIMNQLTERSTA